MSFEVILSLAFLFAFVFAVASLARPGFRRLAAITLGVSTAIFMGTGIALALSVGLTG